MRKVNLSISAKDWSAKQLQYVAAIAIQEEDGLVTKLSAEESLVNNINFNKLPKEEIVNEILTRNNLELLTEDEIQYLNKPLFGRIDKTIQSVEDLKTAAGIQ